MGLGQIKENAYHLMLSALLEHNVQEISVDSLKAEHEKFILLDARSLEERKVSFISGSKYVGYKDFNLESVNDIKKDTPIVVYCSVGYRSEKIAQQLSEAGFKNVANLYGGIFEWVNKAYGLSNNEGECNNIHGFSWTWSKWIDSRDGLKVVY